jgi:NhaP-type Na+/H+ or K+/H+ antiporter
MDQHLLYTMAAVLVLGVGAQWLSWRLKLPSILFLLILGILAGPVTGLLDPDAMFGPMLFPMVSLGVALVLFEGGMTLRFRDLRGHGRVVTNLVSWGALLNWLLIAAGCHYVAGLPGDISMLFAALAVVTGPTVINPLLRTMRAEQHVSQVLRWEGILIDPVGALLAVLVFQYLLTGQGSWQLFASSIGFGVATGLAGAWSLGFVLRRHWVPEYLLNVLTLAWVVMVFAGSDFLAHESGLLAVTIMGVWLGNMRNVAVNEILSFKESLSVLIISCCSWYSAPAYRRTRCSPWVAGHPGAAGGAAGAPPGGLAGDPGQQLPLAAEGTDRLGGAARHRRRRRLLPVRPAPRGNGQRRRQRLVALTFLVIIATVLLQSVSARKVTALLGLAEAEPNGMLIVGANPVARALGVALRDQGFRVKLADTSYEEIRAARMAGLEVYYGDPVSSHAEQFLELVGIGRLFAVSRRSRWNTLACMKYRSEFGTNRVFSLRKPRTTTTRSARAWRTTMPRRACSAPTSPTRSSRRCLPAAPRSRPSACPGISASTTTGARTMRS